MLHVLTGAGKDVRCAVPSALHVVRRATCVCARYLLFLLAPKERARNSIPQACSVSLKKGSRDCCCLEAARAAAPKGEGGRLEESGSFGGRTLVFPGDGRCAVRRALSRSKSALRMVVRPDGAAVRPRRESGRTKDESASSRRHGQKLAPGGPHGRPSTYTLLAPWPTAKARLSRDRRSVFDLAYGASALVSVRATSGDPCRANRPRRLRRGLAPRSFLRAAPWSRR